VIIDFACRIKIRLAAEKGQGMVEYALILGLVVIALVLALGNLGDRLFEFFTSAASKISSYVNVS